MSMRYAVLCADVARKASILVVFGSLAACFDGDLAARQTDPVTRSLTWFGYVGGKDIRAACAAGQGTRLRLVYNAVWGEQVRSYDIAAPSPAGATLNARVLADVGNLAAVSIARPADIFGPWNGRTASRGLDRAELAGLVEAVAASDGFGPVRGRMELPSNDFWWTAASCRDGIWGFAAWHHPTDGFTRIKFAVPLYALDPLAATIPPRPPVALPPSALRDSAATRRDNPGWRLAVDKDGARR